MPTNHLSTPYTLKSLSLKNRIVMPPMCQYAVDAQDGIPNEWHYVHYVSRAVGGTGLIIVEMTDVEPDGRITDHDLGLWSDNHIPAYRRIVDEVHRHGSKIGIQIAHAGRKATDAEVPVSSSALAVDESFKTPRALTTEEVQAMVVKFQDAARRAVEAGFDTIEIHGAHGYLIHQFHSPAINQRTDEYGQDLAKFGIEVIQAVKQVMPADMPLIFRISLLEYMENGYDIEHGIDMCRHYKEAGVDIFDISTGGEGGPYTKMARKPGNYPGYQVPMARAVKQALHVPVIAVGILDDAKLAEATIANNDADMVAVGRGMLRDPYWALHALQAVSKDTVVPKSYIRGY
jgi:2,4-dienoyl-CoA reductase-like NADH-dependent reductase (Old Yellow Enzyme family)